MKTFTRKLAFLMIFLSSLAFSAFAQPHYGTVTHGEPYYSVELWICGATIPNGGGGTVSLVAGDEIAIFDGDMLVGSLLLTCEPSVANWQYSHLLAYSLIDNGDYFTGGHPITLKAWDADAGIEYFADDFTFYPNWGHNWPPEEEKFPYSWAYCYIEVEFQSLVGSETLTGTVLKNDVSTPIDGATVSVGGIYSGTTDETGAYTINNVIPETYDITASHPDFVSETQSSVVISATFPVVNTIPVFTLDDPGTISGTIKNTAGTEILDAIVTATHTTSGITDTAMSATNGTYSITGLALGGWTISASKINYIDGSHGSTITVNNGGTPSGKDVILEFKSIVGTVTDAITGLAIVGAAVSVPGTSENTDANGEYILKDIPAGSYTLRIAKTSPISYVIQTFSIAVNTINTTTQNAALVLTDYIYNWNDFVPGDPTDYTWTLYIQQAQFAGINMVAYDEIAIFDKTKDDIIVGWFLLDQVCHSGNKLENDLIAFHTLINPDDGYGWGNNFTFKAYNHNTQAVYDEFDYTLTISPETYSGAVFPTGDDQYSFLTINFTNDVGSITGNVTKSIGGNIGGAIITATYVGTLTEYTATSDVDGNYAILNLPPGTYDVLAQALGFVDKEYEDIVVNSGVPTEQNIAMVAADDEVPQAITLTTGYQFISRNVTPANINMGYIVRINDNIAINGGPGNLDYIKNTDAKLYSYISNSWNNNIGNWKIDEGYLCKMTANDELNIIGYLIDHSIVTIFLENGFQFIPYLPNSAQDAQTAFADILENMVWAKNSNSEKLIKIGGTWINNIGNISPGEGIQVKMDLGAGIKDTLIYPDPTKAGVSQSFELQHFIFTGGNAADPTYTIYIDTEEFEAGDEVAAFDGDKLVGAMVIEGTNPWHNDLNSFRTLNESQGFIPGNPIILKAWSASQDKEFDLTFEFSDPYGIAYMSTVYPSEDMRYSLATIKTTTFGITELDKDLIKVYPNPATELVNIYSPVSILEVEIYDLLGNKIYSSDVDNVFISINSSEFAPGVYILQLNYGNGVVNKKLSIQ